MKKKLLLISIIFSLLFAACGNNNNGSGNSNNSSENVSEAPKKAIDELNANEKTLFDAIIKMTSADFNSPSSAKVLDIKSTTTYVNEVVAVRIEGETKAGGTTNEYFAFIVAVGTNDKLSDDQRKSASKSQFNQGKYCAGLSLYGSVGEYRMLKDDSEVKGTATGYSVGNINRAISEYWEEKGF